MSTQGREGHVVPGVVVNLLWAGWVIEGVISIGTQVLFHLPSRCLFTVAKGRKSKLKNGTRHSFQIHIFVISNQRSSRQDQFWTNKTLLFIFQVQFDFSQQFCQPGSKGVRLDLVLVAFLTKGTDNINPVFFYFASCFNIWEDKWINEI